MRPEQRPTLHRGIVKWELVLLFINSVIGAGIFGLPSKIYALSGVYSLLAFVVCAAVMLIFILCFAEVSSQFDQTGGPYVYILTAFGRLPAFAMGWLLIMNRIFNYATLINLLVIYAAFFSESFHAPLVRAIVIVLLTLLLAFVNHIGLKNATWTSTVLTIAKLVPLTVFVLVGLFALDPGTVTKVQTFQLSSFTTSVLLLVFAFGGFESMLINSGEIDRPHRNIPFALITSCAIIAVYYCLIQLVCIGTLPALETSERPLAEAAQRFMGPSGGSLIAAGALLSIVGTLNVLLLSGSRMPFALSLEKQLPPALAYIHPRFRTPTYSLAAITIAILAVSLLWSFFTALAIASIIRILVYLLVCASLIRLRRANPDRPSFRIRYAFWVATAGIVLSLWLLSASKWKEIVAVTLVVAAGILVHLVLKKTAKRQDE